MTETGIEEAVQENKTILKKIIKICQCLDFPTAVFDSNFECVYSKDGLIKLSSKANSYLVSDYTLEDLDFFTTIFMIKGVQYCAKILRTDGYYICGLFDSHELGGMARNTDFFNRVISSIDVVQYNLSKLWEIMDNLQKSGNVFLAVKMKQSLMRTNRISQSIFEYANIFLKEPKPVRIDCFQMISAVVKRCNTFLAKCGRFIDFVGDDTKPCFIGADNRHAIVAFISAIQNSLLYSTKDCIPIITLSTTEENHKTYVVLKIVNDIAFYTSQQKEFYESDFANNKIGCGIPIIKRFVEETNGEFELNEINGNVYTLIKIPAVKAFKKDMLFFESGEYVFYETGIPDFLELKISEVVDLFNQD